MRVGGWALGVVLVLSGAVVAATGAGAQGAQDSARLSRDWKRLETPSLVVVGNARDSELRHVGLEMERFRRSLTRLGGSLEVDGPVPTTVIVFRDDGAFSPFKPRQRGRINHQVAGYFMSLPHVNYIALAPTGSRQFTYQLIFHEYTHYLVNRNFRRLPLWLNEGFAEFYSTFAGSDRDGRTIVGRPIDWHVATLLERTLMPLERFVRPTAPGELSRDPHGTRLLYAQSWALTHYLMVGNGGARRPQLLRFVEAVHQGIAMDVAFTAAFGPDLQALDRELQAYVRQFQLPALLLPSETVALEGPVSPLREVEAQQVQGDLLLQTGAYEQAERHLSAALALDPAHVPARLSRAMLRLSRDDTAGALEITGAADLQTSSDFTTHFVHAEALRRSERFADAVAAYRRAITLRRDAPHAYYGLSIAQLAAGERGAAASFTTCMTQSPAPEWYRRRQLDVLRLGLDDFVVSDAINYIDRAGWQGDEATYVMLPAAITLLRTGKREEADEVLATIATHVKPESWQADLVAFFTGTLAPDALIAKARRDEGLLTEAYAYAGIRAHLAGDRDTARRHLEWVKTNGRKDFIEYGFALGELRRLDKTGDPDAQP